MPAEPNSWVFAASPVFIRGGGDLGTGAAIALVEAGLDVVVIDLAWPTALRLTAAFAAAARSGELTVGGVTGVCADTLAEVREAVAARRVAVWNRGEEALRGVGMSPGALVEARMQGVANPALAPDEAPVVVALGPGYEAGVHCHYVVETNRGPRLGAVIENGVADEHTGVPGHVMGLAEERLLRSPVGGVLSRVRNIGDFVVTGEVVATVAGAAVEARIDGMVRGLMLDGLEVVAGKKVGDVDPRRDRGLLRAPSDKAERVGAGVAHALRRAHDRATG